MRNEFAVASLLLGIFSLTIIRNEKAALAIVFGILALREIKREEMSGKNLAILGIILGEVYVVIVMSVLPNLSQYLKL
jgi:hypothetical protein